MFLLATPMQDSELKRQEPRELSYRFLLEGFDCICNPNYRFQSTPGRGVMDPRLARENRLRDLIA